MLALTKHLIAYRVLLARNDTPGSTSSHPQFLAIVNAADLAGAHCQANTLVMSLHGHFDILGIQENAMPFVRPRRSN
jgi:hypothetical protein